MIIVIFPERLREDIEWAEQSLKNEISDKDLLK